jgi:putative hydrolase of the HAD superfamily
MIRAVVFDLDDTLYPEVEFVYSGYRAVSDAVRQHLGFDIVSELVQLFETGQRGDLFTPVLKTHLDTVTEEYVRELVGVYRQHLPSIVPFPEARQVLDVLQRTYRLALVSDGYHAVQARKLEALGLGGYFNPVIFSDAFGRDFWKPHPRPFEECISRLSLAASAIVYVGDNPNKDFKTARQMTMKTIRVRRAGTLHYNVRLSPEFEADYETRSLGEIPLLLKSINTESQEGHSHAEVD